MQLASISGIGTPTFSGPYTKSVRNSWTSASPKRTSLQGRAWQTHLHHSTVRSHASPLTKIQDAQLASETQPRHGQPRSPTTKIIKNQQAYEQEGLEARQPAVPVGVVAPMEEETRVARLQRNRETQPPPQMASTEKISGGRTKHSTSP